MKLVRTQRNVAAWCTIGLLALSSCSSSKSKSSSAESNPTPATNASVAVAVTTAPAKQVGGSLVSSDPPTTESGMKRWRIVFTTQLGDGSEVQSSGLVYVPDRDAPPGGWPVASYAHATVGIADKCAPSANPGFAESIIASLFGDQNMAVVMSDYPGMGTSGDNYFLDGPSAGNSVLDIARAAKQIEGVTLSERTVLIGHSQGGHAALFAAENAAVHAPELQLAAVVAGAPPSQLNKFVGALAASPRRGYVPLVATGLVGENPSLNLDDILTPAGVEVAKSFNTECADAIIETASTADLLKSPTLPKAWQKALDADEPGRRGFAAPLLLFHGENDDLVPLESSAVLAEEYRALGVKVERKTYPGADHAGVVLLALGDVSEWVTNIINPPTDTVPTASAAEVFPGAKGALRAVLEQGESKPLVIAHAGGEQELPHSTPYAFAESVKRGVDVLEMDVRVTKDQQLIVFHDPTVDRTTNETGPVADRTLAEMQRLDAAYNFAPGCWDCRSGSSFPMRGVRTGALPPPAGYSAEDFAVVTLDALLTKYPDSVFDIEIKTDGPDGGNEVASALAKRLLADPKPDRFVVVSFDDEALKVFRDAAPSIPTSPGFGEITSYVLADKPLSPTPVVQIPPSAQSLELFNEAFREKAKRDGIAIWVWPLDFDTDNADNYRKILEGKPNGIIAGRPSELLPLVAQGS